MLGATCVTIHTFIIYILRCYVFVSPRYALPRTASYVEVFCGALSDALGHCPFHINVPSITITSSSRLPQDGTNGFGRATNMC
jgi:hypothetical protein